MEPLNNIDVIILIGVALSMLVAFRQRSPFYSRAGVVCCSDSISVSIVNTVDEPVYRQ